MEEILEIIRAALEKEVYQVLNTAPCGDHLRLLVTDPGNGVQYMVTIHDPT